MNSQQGLKRCHRGRPPVESENVFVQITLKVLGGHSMTCSIHPGFQVAENAVSVNSPLVGQPGKHFDSIFASQTLEA